MGRNQSKDKLSTIAVLCKVADVKEKLYDEATEKYEIDCENPDFELAYDEAYTTYYDTCKNIAELLVDVSGGKIDKPTALTMAFDRRSKIECIIQYT